MKESFSFEVIPDGCFTRLKIHNTKPVTPEYCEIMMILVSSAKLMIGSVLRTKVSFHSFSLESNGLTIVIEDYTKYSVQNATNVAKHLQRVYSVLMSRFGCRCGLKY